MRMHPECYPCFMRQALEAARMVTDDENTLMKVMKAVAAVLPEVDANLTPMENTGPIHVRVRDVTGCEDPYADVKRKLNSLALEMYPVAREIVRRSDDPLWEAVKMSIVGNYMDYGAQAERRFEDLLTKVANLRFSVNRYGEFRKAVERAEDIGFVGDNAGEIVFDRLLIETMGKRITYYVRGYPWINDVTVEDARAVGMDRVAEIDVVPATRDRIDLRGEEFLRKLRGHDVVIFKGQGNFEALHGVYEHFFLLMAKCPVVARAAGGDVGTAFLL